LSYVRKKNGVAPTRRHFFISGSQHRRPPMDFEILLPLFGEAVGPVDLLDQTILGQFGPSLIA